MKSEESETAIKVLTKKINKETKPDEALKYTQAALNLAHVLATIYNIKTK